MQRIREFRKFLSDRWSEHLDALHGECVLRRPDCSRLVADSLRHFDEDRYSLCDYVVMPNHVHVLAAFADEEAMLSQCESWKRYRGGSTKPWEETDAFGPKTPSTISCVRPTNLNDCALYIAENPQSAAPEGRVNTSITPRATQRLSQKMYSSHSV